MNQFRILITSRSFVTYFLSGFFVSMVLVTRFYIVFTQPESTTWQDYYGQVVRLEGNVLKESLKNGRKWLTVQTSMIDEQQVRGRILVRVPPGQTFAAHDGLIMVGALEQWQTDGIDALRDNRFYGVIYFPNIEKVDASNIAPFDFKHFIVNAQKFINSRFDQLLPEPHASLLAGIVFGIERELSHDFNERLRKAGVIHVVVASGFNAVVVARLLIFISKTVPVELATFARTVIVISGLLIYAGVTGFQIPILRAIVMSGGQLLAEQTGEYREGLVWLFISAYVLLLWQPRWLFSVSFQLSFTASLGLILFGTTSQIYFKKYLPSFINEAFSTTLIAQLFTLPVLWVTFGEIAWVGLLANILVIEIIPIIMFAGAVCFGATLISSWLGQVLGWFLWLLLEYFVRVVYVFT